MNEKFIQGQIIQEVSKPELCFFIHDAYISKS